MGDKRSKKYRHIFPMWLKALSADIQPGKGLTIHLGSLCCIGLSKMCAKCNSVQVHLLQPTRGNFDHDMAQLCKNGKNVKN